MYWKRRFFENIGQSSDIPYAMDVHHAKGSYLYDNLGHAYLDFVSGFSVVNIGHCNPEVIAAISQQAAQYMHTTVYGEHIQSVQIEYATLLKSNLPSSLDSVYFLSTGSETIDAAIKLSRSYNGRSEIITCSNAYHGSTIGAESLRSDAADRSIFYPLIPDVRWIRYGNMEDLKKISIRTSAIIMEVYQAEAGVQIAHQEYFDALRKQCDLYGVLLVFDEIQTGIGRTAKMFGFQYTDVIPDILLLGKALGAGLPLAALIANKNILQRFQNNPALSYITSFGGNPVCCAAGFAGLQYMLRGKLIPRAQELELIIRKKLSHRSIIDIRGKGLFIAVELYHEISIHRVVSLALESNLIIEGFLFNKNSIRIMPPLDIKEVELNHGLDILLEVLDKLS